MTQEWTNVDKTTWGPGPWQSEPDKVQWVDPATGLDCLMVRNDHYGNWCGYVGVAEGHPAFGLLYGDVRFGPCPDEEHWNHECSPSVHGGLTYAAACQEDAEEGHGICHIPEPGRPGHIWWLGFDCGHAFDAMPAMAAREAARYAETGDPIWRSPSLDRMKVYRDRAYVEAEIARLASQLVGLTARANWPVDHEEGE